jgi:hypothetical protein
MNTQKTGDAIMAALTFHEIVEAAEHLTEAEQRALISHLQARLRSTTRLTLAQIQAEHQRRFVLGQFRHTHDLFGKYANPAFDSLSYEALEEIIHAAATEWEQEIDEFAGDT